MANKPYHGAEHRRLGTPAVRAAYADPEYRCPRCGLTLDEGREAWGTNGEWERGHKIAGRQARSTADYQAEHRRCNRSEGASQGNRAREPHSELW